MAEQCLCETPLLCVCPSQHHSCHLHSWVSRGRVGRRVCVWWSLHPPPRIRQTLINWEECKHAGAAGTRDGSERRTVEGEKYVVCRKGKEKEKKSPHLPPPPPLRLVYSPPRRLIQSFPEQCSSCGRGGPETRRPYGPQMYMSDILFGSLTWTLANLFLSPVYCLFYWILLK